MACPHWKSTTPGAETLGGLPRPPRSLAAPSCLLGLGATLPPAGGARDAGRTCGGPRPDVLSASFAPAESLLKDRLRRPRSGDPAGVVLDQGHRPERIIPSRPKGNCHLARRGRLLHPDRSRDCFRLVTVRPRLRHDHNLDERSRRAIGLLPETQFLKPPIQDALADRIFRMLPHNATGHDRKAHRRALHHIKIADPAAHQFEGRPVRTARGLTKLDAPIRAGESDRRSTGEAQTSQVIIGVGVAGRKGRLSRDQR